MDCSSPGTSIPGILQARMLEWVATSSSRGSSGPRNQTRISYVSHIVRWVLYHWFIDSYNFKVKKAFMSFNSGVPNLWDPIPYDLKWSWCSNNRNKVHNKCNVLESSKNHPPDQLRSVEKLSSAKLVPGAQVIRDHWLNWTPRALLRRKASPREAASPWFTTSLRGKLHFSILSSSFLQTTGGKAEAHRLTQHP